MRTGWSVSRLVSSSPWVFLFCSFIGGTLCYVFLLVSLRRDVSAWRDSVKCSVRSRRGCGGGGMYRVDWNEVSGVC